MKTDKEICCTFPAQSYRLKHCVLFRNVRLMLPIFTLLKAV